LDPQEWYPYFPEARDLSAFHVNRLQTGFAMKDPIFLPGRLAFTTVQNGGLVSDLAARFADAVTGIAYSNGKRLERKGSLDGPHGAVMTGADRSVQAMPPAEKGADADFESDKSIASRGLGETFAIFPVSLPPDRKLQFVATVNMDGRAVGKNKTDGVTFTVLARSDGEEIRASIHAATTKEEELALDLSQFAGRKIELELRVGAGPQNNATEDRALWHFPRVEENLATPKGLVSLAHPPAWVGAAAQKAGYPAVTDEASGSLVLEVPMPGPVELVSAPEEEVPALPNNAP
jgi:hypothetical protein